MLAVLAAAGRDVAAVTRGEVTRNLMAAAPAGAAPVAAQSVAFRPRPGQWPQAPERPALPRGTRRRTREDQLSDDSEKKKQIRGTARCPVADKSALSH